MKAKNQKRVLQIITKSNFGGAQKYVLELSTELKKRNFDVIVAFGGSGLLKEKLEKENIKTITLKSLQRDVNLLSDLKVFIELVKIIRKEKPDIVHLNSSKIGAIGSFAAQICLVPKIVFTIHGLAFNENRSVISKAIIKNIYWWTILMSSKVIAVSENIKSQILTIPLSSFWKRKIITIRNQIRPLVFLSRDEARNFINQKINKKINDKKIIGTIAELHHIKGLNYLIESAKRLLEKNEKLIFVVFGEGEERKKIEKQIIENHLENHFFLLGFVDNAYQYLKGLDLFVLTSISEALALVILEARQANLKIVASNVGGIPEAIKNYEKAILFETKNTEDLVSKIELAIKSELQTKSEENSQKDFDEMIKKVIDLYNS